MQRQLKIIITLAVILLVGIGVIVAVSDGNNKNDKISIVATNFPAYDFARAVAGDAAEIKMLVSPGAEVHDYEPSPSDIADILESDLFIYTGGESDAWIEDVLNDIDASHVQTLKMMDEVEAAREETVEGMEAEEDDSEENSDEEVEYDEHVWTSLKNAIQIISAINGKLAELSPENAEQFENNTREYTAKLSELDSKFQDTVASSRRKVVVFGDRFPLRYFMDDYGLTYFAAFPGCSEQTEADSHTIAFLVDKVKSEQIPVVFKIEMSSGDIANTIATETGTKVLTFNSAHNISADDFDRGLTYAEIMEDNLSVLEEALK